MTPFNCILLVDDSKAANVLHERILKAAFPDTLVLVLENGREAWLYFQGKGRYANRKHFPLPDLMLLDINMPVMNGFELLQKFHQANMDLPKTIMLSTSLLNKDKENAQNLGAQAYFNKPLSPDKLDKLDGDFFFEVA